MSFKFNPSLDFGNTAREIFLLLLLRLKVLLQNLYFIDANKRSPKTTQIYGFDYTNNILKQVSRLHAGTAPTDDYPLL